MNEENTPTLNEVFLKIPFGKFHLIVMFICGCIVSLYATELILLSFLGPILTCEWPISRLESSFVSSFTLLGAIIGALLFGKFSDNFGRKITILICISGIFYYHILSSLSPTVLWVILTRTFVGLFVGGAMITIPTYLSEIMPLFHRGKTHMGVQMFWTFGSYYITLMTIILVPKYGWKLWLIISICPMILLIPASIWLPESPRYLLLVQRKSEAINVINKIAVMNNAEKITNVKTLNYKQSSFDAFHSTYISTTIISSFLNFLIGFSFYTFVSLSAIINNIPHKCLQNMSRISDLSIYINSSIDNSCCFIITWDTMKTVFLSITGELINFIFGILLVQILKRKMYMQLLFMINSIVFFLINLCLSPVVMGILMMLGRGSAILLLVLQYIYLSEVFPTTNRSFNTSLCSSFIRIGGFTAPLFVNMIMIQTSFLISTLFISILNIIGIISVFFLPFETKDRALMQHVEDEISEKELINSFFK